MGFIDAQIAIVDDDPAMVEVLAELFADERPGLTVAAFTDPCRALEAIAHKRIGIVVADVNMPVINGADLLRSCLKMEHGCKVILISGDVSGATAMSAYCDGARAFIAKPFQASEILAVVDHCLEELVRWNDSIAALAQKRRA